MPIIDGKALKHLRKIQMHRMKGIKSSCASLGTCGYCFLINLRFSNKRQLLFPSFSFQKILLGVDLRAWFLTFTNTFNQNFECSRYYDVLLFTNARSTTSSALAKAICFLILSFVIRRMNVRICTSPSEVLIHIIAKTISNFIHFLPFRFQYARNFWYFEDFISSLSISSLTG